ncbi:MAG: isoprenylcysteine carboxylmethyltransferase family protein [Bdellovibrionales bacterium]
MALVHEWEKQGNILFVNRSWIPAIFVLAGFGFLYFTDFKTIPESFSWAYILFCSSFVFLGQFIRSFAVGFADKNTSGRNTSDGQVADSINKTGIYSLVRHPLYLGNYFQWLGALLFCGSWEFAFVSTLAYIIYYERIMFAEEQFLRKKFGQEYDLWSANTPAILPKLGGYTPSRNSFNWRDMVRREYLGFCAAFYVMSFYGAFSASIQAGTFAIDPIVLQLFYVTFGFFIVIRILAKATKVLSPVSA